MIRRRAKELLSQMLNDPEASFRDGQLECIIACVEKRGKLLVVQKTGWGKSFVYFIATKLLREEGAGPTLLISPLLSLMRNQVAMASRIGIRAINLDSTNLESWSGIVERLKRDECDTLLISPERLRSQEFSEKVLPAMRKGIGMFVVDEAHSISDWGHDFRPDYRRIRKFVRNLPISIPLLATTATASDRVVHDIVEQLGSGLKVNRGPLIRESLQLQCIELPSHAERLAWLAENVKHLPGSGIIYCLTKRDCELVANWLTLHGVLALPYHSDLHHDAEENNRLRQEREEALQKNLVKTLVATVALGMGYDKPDLGFVIHFQRPGSIVAYYQQIGRAGRSLDKAIVVMLYGCDEDKIISYFIDTAFPAENIQQNIISSLRQSENGLTIKELSTFVNQTWTRMDQCLRYLEIEGIVRKSAGQYLLVPAQRWISDSDHQALISEMRYRELEMMRQFCRHDGCLMEFVARALDDPYAGRCGKCANCAGDFLPRTVDPLVTQAATQFLRKRDFSIEPRRRWPTKDSTPWNELNIHIGRQLDAGKVLCYYLDEGWGRLVVDGKYRANRFDDQLVEAACDLIRNRWSPYPPIEWVTAIPSRRRPELVPDFARRLATKLRIPFRMPLSKTCETAEQKTMQNSSMQMRNLAGSFSVNGAHVLRGPVILVDDVVDSRWTMTYTGALLLDKGVSRVYPFALALAATGGAG